MELKKSTKADLQNKKSTFMLTGIVISMCLAISLFSWSKSEKKIETMAVAVEEVEQEVAEITIQEEKPIEVPKTIIVTSDILNIRSDNTKIDNNIQIFDESMLTDSNIEIKDFGNSKAAEEEVKEDIPVLKADKMPTFQGGTDAKFKNWVQEGLVYPQTAADNGISGTVVVQFVIERDGSLTNIKVLRSVDRDLDATAVNKIKQSPKWTPGENRGRPVRVTFTIPVQFRLNN